MKKYIKELCIVFFSCMLLLACSEAENKEEWTPSTQTISISFEVEEGAFSRGIGDDGVLEGNYQLSKIYMWVNTSEGWKIIGLPCTDGGFSIQVRENKDGTVTVVQDEQSITFKTENEVKFASSDTNTLVLSEATIKTPGGKSTYRGLEDDMIFRSTITNFKYSLTAHAFTSGRVNLSNGLTMQRRNAAIYVNMIVCDLETGVQEGDKIIYNYSEANWLEKFGARADTWSAMGFLTNYPYEYNWETDKQGKTGILALGEQYVNFAVMSFQHSDSGTNITSVYNGIGAHSKGYLYIFPTDAISYLNFSFNDPLYGSATSQLDSRLVFSPNTTYVFDIVYDVEEIYNAPFVPRSVQKRNPNPARIYMNGELVMKNK